MRSHTHAAGPSRLAHIGGLVLLACAIALTPARSQPGSGTGGGGGGGGGRGQGQGVFEFDEARYDPDARPSPDTVRCAVIGGMAFTTHMFSAVAEMFEAENPYKVIITEVGQRPVLDRAMRAGRADLLTMHSGDITTNLVADGYGANMRPWTRNDLVIMGPPSDPAGIRGLKSGAEALKETDSHLDLLAFAEAHEAYIIVGRTPVVLEKLPSHHLEIMVECDPVMRRPYIVMEANPLKAPGGQLQGGPGAV